MNIQKKLIFYIISGFFLILQFNKVALAKVNKTILDNGLTVITKEEHYQPIVALQMWVKAGSADETESNSGVSHFIEHMLFKGTSNLKPTEISKTIENKGGTINAATSKDFTYYHIVIPTEYLKIAVDLLGDIIMNSTFPPEEVETERLVILEEIKRRQDNPYASAWDLFNKNIYEGHPYSRTVLGTSQTLTNMPRETLLEYYNRFYVPDNMCLVVVGDFDTSHLVSEIKHTFSNFTRKAGKIEKHKRIQQNPVNILEEKQVQQAYIIIGTLGPEINDADQYAMDILSYILGGGRSSRLYRKLQEEEKLVYSINTSFLSLKEQGVFYITATCNPEKIPLVKKRVLEELAKIKNEKVPEEELKRAKTILKSEYILSKQIYADEAFGLGYYQTIYNYKFDISYLKNMKKVTSKKILEAINTYFDLDKMTSIVIKPELAQRRRSLQIEEEVQNE